MDQNIILSWISILSLGMIFFTLMDLIYSSDDSEETLVIKKPLEQQSHILSQLDDYGDVNVYINDEDEL